LPGEYEDDDEDEDEKTTRLKVYFTKLRALTKPGLPKKSPTFSNARERNVRVSK
jgi:hypothetical protein